MRDKVIRPERRGPGRQNRLAALGDVVDEGAWSERRVHCWDLDPECTESRRRRCAAHFVRRNCWDLWAAEFFPPGRKPCCRGDLDCSECPTAAAKFKGPIPIYVETPRSSGAREASSAAAARPLVYCPFLYSVKDASGPRADGEMRLVFRCQRRRGIQLDGTYVSDVCGSREYSECTFYGTE